jgi:hypothetical protein
MIWASEIGPQVCMKNQSANVALTSPEFMPFLDVGIQSPIRLLGKFGKNTLLFTRRPVPTQLMVSSFRAAE